MADDDWDGTERRGEDTSSSDPAVALERLSTRSKATASALRELRQDLIRLTGEQNHTLDVIRAGIVDLQQARMLTGSEQQQLREKVEQVATAIFGSKEADGNKGLVAWRNQMTGSMRIVLWVLSGLGGIVIAAGGYELALINSSAREVAVLQQMLADHLRNFHGQPNP
jgi:hypothetical protein